MGIEYETRAIQMSPTAHGSRTIDEKAGGEVTARARAAADVPVNMVAPLIALRQFSTSGSTTALTGCERCGKHSVINGNYAPN